MDWEDDILREMGEIIEHSYFGERRYIKGIRNGEINLYKAGSMTGKSTYNKERNMTNFKVNDEVVMAGYGARYSGRVVAIDARLPNGKQNGVVILYRSSNSSDNESPYLIDPNAGDGYTLERKPETTYMTIYSNGERGSWNVLENCKSNEQYYVTAFPKITVLGRVSADRTVVGGRTVFSNAKFNPA